MVDAPSTPAHLVDDALLERELVFADDFSLLTHDRWLAQLATSIQLGGSAGLQQRLRHAFVERLKPYHDWHDKHAPFPVVPRGSIDTGPVTIGKQVDGTAVTLLF